MHIRIQIKGVQHSEMYVPTITVREKERQSDREGAKETEIKFIKLYLGESYIFLFRLLESFIPSCFFYFSVLV